MQPNKSAGIEFSSDWSSNIKKENATILASMFSRLKLLLNMY